VTAQETPASIDIIIVAFNSIDYIDRCIGSIISNTTITSIKIYFIDNGTDGCADFVRHRFPDVKIVPSRGNIGFGAACNLLARLSSSPYILLLNPDTYLESPAIDELVSCTRLMPDAWAWGGRTHYPNGEFDAGNRLMIPTLSRTVRAALGNGRALSSGGLPINSDRPAPVDVLVGGFMMVKRIYWELLGGFDESFFMYSEDIDFFTRLKCAGGIALMTPNSVIVHDVGSGSPNSPRRTLYKTIGQMHFVQKHWNAVDTTIAGCAIWFGAVLRTVKAVLQRREAPYLSIALHPARWWRGYTT